MANNFDNQHNAWQKQGLHHRMVRGVGTHFALLMGLVLLVSFLLISFLSLKHQQEQVYGGLKEKGQLLGRFVATISPEAIYSYDFNSLNNFTKELALHKNIAYSVVIDPQGQALTSFLDKENLLTQDAQKQVDVSPLNVIKQLKQREDIIHLAFPIKDEGYLLGEVWIGMSTQQANQLLKASALAQFWLNLGLVICISLGILIIFRLKILYPIHTLMEATHKVSSGNFEQSIEINSHDEFGALANSFNFMIQAVQQNNENFNHMIEMLQTSMTEQGLAVTRAEEQNWLNEGIRLFVEETRNSYEILELGNKSVDNLTRRLDLLAATLFLYEGSDLHKIASSVDLGGNEKDYINPKKHAVLEPIKKQKQTVLLEEQVLLTQQQMADSPIMPWVYYLPLTPQDKLYGLLELAFIERPSSIQLAFLQHISAHLAISIYAAQQQQQTEKALQLTQEKTQQLEQTSTELRIAMTETERATKAKSVFLANMSHELRTPLNAILGFSEMIVEDLEADDGDEEMIKDVRKIHQAGQSLLALVNDVLDISKIESGKMEVYVESINLAELLDNVINTVTPLAEKNNCYLRLEADDTVQSRNFYADLTKVRQVLLNLLSNAIKFGQNNPVSLHVKYRDEYFEFYVKDRGIGISPDKIHTLFQAFTQADASTTRKYGGTGLGLTICKEFIELMGGSIEVETELNKGSCFIIKVPEQVECIKEKDAQPRGQTSAEQTDLSAIKLNTIKENGIILVVDDDYGMRELLAEHLEKLGYHAALAASGEDALSIAQKLKPDAITLDVMMPDMDGWEVLTRLKSDPELMQIPVVMVSIVEDKTKGYALGATEYLIKPVERAQLASVLRKYRDNADPLVMLLEDDDTTRMMMTNMLERTQCNVISAENGKIALQRLQQHQPDVILLDLMMPEMDGLEFAQVLHNHPQWQKIPIIVLTAKDLTPEERQQLSGCVEVIYQKGNFRRTDLLAQIQQRLAAALHKNGGFSDAD